ncbi:MAG: filamentous hemagglutinin N-terminal domain-containing protein [Nitrospira sp.]
MDRASFLFLSCAILGFVLLLGASQGSLGFAQTAPPITSTTGAGNLGTAVSQAGNTYNITGGTRPGNGANLFHSFGQFGIPTNNTANFLNDSGLATSNILGRVTGGNPSNIFGTIQTTGFGSANLFLMNPAGIVFGPNASLNVGGSVSFTTADYLRFTDGARFSAIPGPADASISSAPVAAFGFLGSNPGAITVQGGELSVLAGQNISLVGGNITVESGTLADGTVRPAQLVAPAGTISLASVASPGEILAGILEQVPNVNGQSFGALGTIQISQKSVIDSSGYDGGTIRIRGGSFVVDDSTISANVTGPPSGQPGQAGTGIDIQMTEDVVIRNRAVLETNVTEQASPGVGSGGVRIRADHIEMVGINEFDLETFTFPFTGIRSDVAPTSVGRKSGNIWLEANTIHMADASRLQTQTESASDGGNITVRAVRNIESENYGSISAATQGSFDKGILNSGNAGNIELTSTQGSILLASPFITSQTSLSSGRSGNITLNAPNGDIVLSQGGSVFNAADGTTGSLGKVEVNAQNLTLHGFSLIEGDNLTPQVPDNITVMLSGQLRLDGHSVIATNAWRSAPAADLTITAPKILVTEGSRLTAETFRSGQGGRLNLFTDNLQVTNGGQIRSGSSLLPFDPPEGLSKIPSGGGGTITVQNVAGPAQSIVIDGVGSGIFTDAQGTGAGGSINLAAQSIAVQNGGIVSASTSGIEPTATGGHISVLANQSVTLSNGGSIVANSTGPANAGNIVINAGAQFLSQNGNLSTAANQASGGNITIQATDSIRLVNSQLSTSVQGGPNTTGGNILLDPAVVTLQNSQVTAQAVQGQGGNISIIAGTFLADQTSIVSASSQFGLSGTVNIQSPVSSLSNTLATLPQRPLQAQNLLTQRCAAQLNGQLSSLVVAGRDALPVEPGGWLMSPLASMADDEPAPQAHLTTSRIFEPSHHNLGPLGQLSDQHDSSSPRGVKDRETGCGS